MPPSPRPPPGASLVQGTCLRSAGLAARACCAVVSDDRAACVFAPHISTSCFAHCFASRPRADPCVVLLLALRRYVAAGEWPNTHTPKPVRGGPVRDITSRIRLHSEDKKAEFQARHS